VSTAHPLMFCACCLRVRPACTCMYFHQRGLVTPGTLPSTIDHRRPNPFEVKAEAAS
jgi:hypothetical protein